MKNCFNKSLILLLFIYFIPVSCSSIHSSSENLVQGLIIKTKPKTAKSKRLRLTDQAVDAVWKGEPNKNTLKIDLGSIREVNRIRFQVKKDVAFQTVKVKAGTTQDNESLVLEAENVNVLANEWVVFEKFSINARYISLVLKGSRPRIYELEVQSITSDFKLGNDFNNDGFDDWIVSAYLHDAGGPADSNRGKVFVYLGGASLSSSPALSFNGDLDGEGLGSSVSGIGDVNQDGFDDFAIGVSGYDGAGTNRGRVLVFLGGTSISLTPALTINGDEDGAFLGSSVSGGSDVNGDGYDDFVVGAFQHDAGGGSGADRGCVYVYLGGSSLTSTPAIILNGDKDDGAFGVSVGCLGDVNGDGLDDFMVGAGSHDATGINRGRAYIYLGGENFSETPELTLTGDEDQARLGSATAGIGDVNGDGFNDYIVGAYLHSAGGLVNSARGRAYVYLGGATLSDVPILVASGDEDVAFLGASLSGVGDINNDNFNDFAVGAYLHDAGGGASADWGRVYVYLGGASIDQTPILTLNGNEDSGYFGFSVASLGDANNDGFDDFIISATNHNAGAVNDRGRAYIYFGASTPDSGLDFFLDGDEDFALFGFDL